MEYGDHCTLPSSRARARFPLPLPSPLLSEDLSTNTTTLQNAILKDLIARTTPSSSSDSSPAVPLYKYIVNSTIIQHPTAPTGAAAEAAGRRGMHSAVGAYWNNERDGTWSFKWEGADERGMDVVVSVTWVGV